MPPSAFSHWDLRWSRCARILRIWSAVSRIGPRCPQDSQRACGRPAIAGQRARMTQTRSARPVSAIPGITEAWQNVGMLVECLINRRGPNPHVWMQTAQARKALRSTQEADQTHLTRAALLEPIDGGYRRIGGGDHRRNDNDEALIEVGRRLEEVFDGNKGLRLAIEADMGDAGGRHKV